AASKIVLGSRGSELARAQTDLVVVALREAWPGLEIATRVIATSGDKRTAERIDPRAGRKGLFTREIEQSLLTGTIDLAVHSAKDLPSDTVANLEIGAALKRAPVEDVVISRKPEALLADPGCVVATGSVRRQYQLRWKYPGLSAVDLRGNVPTRLRKFIGSDWSAVVLAGAGLRRLGYEIGNGSFRFEGTVLHASELPVGEFLPAGGQGIIAVQIRADDDKARTLVRRINHSETLDCLEAEREFLRLLQGDCGSPVGVLATTGKGGMTMRAQVFEPPRIDPREASVEGSPAAAKQLARELWEAING
ncbi:MAG TPA: hydroxymethylbilane synthase, partial [Chthoniobacterales bacterium]|nr:hydroxymethylbilane synthase [Chthoniobacterales bacterium]